MTLELVTMRIETDILFHWAAHIGVKITYTRLPVGCLGVADASEKIIKLDESLLDCERKLRSVFSEEIGHIIYPPRPGHIRYHSTQFWEAQHSDSAMTKIVVAQDERKALDWATGVLIPDVEFYRIIREGRCQLWEIEDTFDVERWLVEHKIGYYRRKQRVAGKKVRWRDIIRRSHY